MHREPMDEGEIAKEYADRRNQACIAAVLAKARQPIGPGSVICIDCEDEIPLARREAQPGCVRCRDCQEAFD